MTNDECPTNDEGKTGTFFLPSSLVGHSSFLKPSRHLQPVRLHQRRVGEHVSPRAVGDDPAAVEHHHAAARLQDHFQVVGGDQLGPRQAADQCDQPAPAARVEVDRRLVQQQHPGRIASTPARATRRFSPPEQVVRHPLVEPAQADPLQAFARGPPPRRAAGPG